MTNVTTRREKGRAREEAVLRAATQAIAELGLAHVRVADIAERAGIGPGHLTYYFPSKDDLLMQAIRWSEQRFHDEVDDEISGIADPWVRLEKLFDLAAADGVGDPFWALWFEVWAKSVTDPAVAEGGRELEAWWRTSLAEVIRYGSDRGTFRADDIDDIVVTLGALVDGLSIQLALGQGDLTKPKLLDLCGVAARLLLDPARNRGDAERPTSMRATATPTNRRSTP